MWLVVVVEVVGLAQVVSDQQSEKSEVEGGLSECPTPAVFETAVVFDEAVEVLDLQASAVALFPGGSAEGDVLVGVEFFDGDGDGAFAAVFLVDGGGVGCFALGSFAADAGFGVGSDSAVALGASESDSTVLVGFADGFPCVFVPFGVPVGSFFAFEVLGWYLALKVVQWLI